MSLLLRRPPGREAYPGDIWMTIILHLAYIKDYSWAFLSLVGIS